MQAEDVINALQGAKGETDPTRFFKTQKGEYASHDIFWGITAGTQKRIAKEFRELKLKEIQSLLDSPVHEHRHTALHILVLRYSKYKTPDIVEFYLKNLGAVNNWDLVDTSAPHILGHWLLSKDTEVLYKLADSKNMWERRVAIVATLALIKQGQLTDTLALSEKLLTDEHDLMHKAVGWMLREVGKQDERALRLFLKQHGTRMPRTTLRYAIERLDDRAEILASTRL